MNKPHIILAFDIGTQSTRALLITSEGQIAAKAQKGHHPAYISRNPGWAEQVPDFYYDNMCRVARQLRESFPELFAQIEAVTLTTIRSTSICVGDDGKPLRPAILWLDQRRAAGSPELKAWTAAAIKAVGMSRTLQLQYQKSHCNWIRENEPEIWRQTKKYVLLGTYLNYKLTGQMKDSTASIVGYVPYDFKNRRWKKENDLVRPVFDIPNQMMCDLVAPGDVIGRLTKEAAADLGLPAGLKLIATGTDKACEILGLGCVNQKRAAISFGTTATVTFTTGKYLEPEPFILPYNAILPGCYTPEVEIFRGYWLISWFKKEFAQKEVAEAIRLKVQPEEILNKRLKEVPAGCDGLILQPYFTPNLTMPEAKGAVIGFSDVHTRIHLYRAIIEGINFALMDGMRHMEKRGGFRFEEIRVGGGGAQSSEICQITADMFGIPVVRTQTYEVSGIGSAIPAFVTLGVFGSYKEALRHMVHRKDVFYPDKEQNKVYRRLYEEVYKQIYPRLSEIYAKIGEI